MSTNELADYLRRRIEAMGENPASLSQRMGWSISYLTNVISGQFRPSEKRCRELARVFGDDPNLILRLAGFYVQDEDMEELKDFARYKSLKPEHKRLTRLFMEFLKWAEDSDLDRPEGAG